MTTEAQTIPGLDRLQTFLTATRQSYCQDLLVARERGEYTGHSEKLSLKQNPDHNLLCILKEPASCGALFSPLS
tara:strand:- start:11455 stop:11676 length:222 start_codon:yes stop_codon:yes gene_type:complete